MMSKMKKETTCQLWKHARKSISWDEPEQVLIKTSKIQPDLSPLNQVFLLKWLIPRQRKYKMSMDHLVPENKEVLKEPETSKGH